MTGPVDQSISLISFGNDFLQSGELFKFYPENLAFQFCNNVLFSEEQLQNQTGNPNKKLYAANPVEWLQQLKKNNCKKLRLYYAPSEKQTLAKDFQSAAFVGGGGTWMIETIFENTSDFWSNNWKVTNKNDPDRKIWTVYYIRSEMQTTIINLQFDPVEIKGKLHAALHDIKTFALSQKLDFWADWFERAIRTLDAQNPEALFHRRDMLVQKNHPLIARQLLYGAGNAFVFGGMGSWNDIGFKEEGIRKEYDRLSSNLYDRMNQAIICGINFENHDSPGRAINDITFKN